MTQVSIITGSGRGIGKAIALRLAKENNVILTGRTEPDLKKACEEINRLYFGKATYVVGDARSLESANEAISVVEKNGWDLTNIICNAGIGKSGLIHEFNPALWQEIMDVNVIGAFNYAKAGIPLLLKQGKGAICLMSSVAGLQGYKRDSAYCTSKHALLGLAKSMALDYGKEGILVAALCPGFVESDMTERTINGLMTRKGILYEEARQIVASKNPGKRIIPSEEVAELIHAICNGQYAPSNEEPLIFGEGLERIVGERASKNTPKITDLLELVKATTANASALLIPISGGSDSALGFYLCSTVYPEKTTGVFAGKPSALRERAWFESIGKVEYVEIPGTYEERESMRWAKFNAMSIKRKAWLVGSRNKTEDLLGTYSLASRVATFLPIVGIWKSELLDLCSQVGIPQAIIDSSLKADSDCGRSEELSAISYSKIDSFLRAKIGIETYEQKLDPKERNYLEGIYNYNSFKKNLPVRLD